MTKIELMQALINGKVLVDVLDYKPGSASHGGRYSFTYRMDREYKLWVICSYEDSTWERVSDSLAESWKLLKGVDWSEKATWVNEPRWQVS